MRERVILSLVFASLLAGLSLAQAVPQAHDRGPARLQRKGEVPERHRMVPYGINVPEGVPDCSDSTRAALRQRLNLPVDRKIVISVGWIAGQHKRMDYLVNEVAQLPQPRPHLLLLGAIDAQSNAVLSLAKEKLGDRGFTARSVPYKEVADYYRAADIFILASLQEGFGRVFLEALMHGLPVIAHDHPVMRFVLGCERETQAEHVK